MKTEAVRTITVGGLLVSALAILSSCGGMTNAVGVLPNTLDNLKAQSAAARGEGPSVAGCAQPPCEPLPQR